MARWLVIYHNGDGVASAVVEDMTDTNLPFGSEELGRRIAPETEFMVNAVSELPEGFTPQIVIDGREVEPRVVVLDA